MSDSWDCYIIVNDNCSYVGITPDTEKRIKKHNGEISGGAKYTRSRGPGWKYVCIISGFDNKIDTMRFEWAVKHCSPKSMKGITNRIKKLITVLNRERWTSKSPLANQFNLLLTWVDNTYRPDDIQLPDYIEEKL